MAKRGNYERTEEVRNKNRIATLKYLENNPNPFTGKNHSEESKRKISEANFGRKRTEEWKRDSSKRLQGNQYRKGIPHSLETRKKMGLRGENHPNWKGGSAKSTGCNRVEYAEWRKAVFEKSDNCCAVCEKTNVRLVAHHIKPKEKYSELTFNVENGIVLCRSCHHAIHLVHTLFENGVNSGNIRLVKELIYLAE